MIPRSTVLPALLLGLLSAAVIARAAPTEPPGAGAMEEPSPQGAFDAWSLYDFEENGYLVCYLATKLLHSNEDLPRRAASYVLVTNRPAEGKKGVVSVVAGYPYEPGSSVTLTVGKRQFRLFTERDTAWAQDADDKQIVAALHAGTTMGVTGRTKDGEAPTDTYSLKGAVQALTALDHLCPIAGPPKPKAAPKKKAT